MTLLLFKCRWRHCWRAATCGQLTKNIYQLDTFIINRFNNSSLRYTFWCQQPNPKTNGSKLKTWRTLCNFFLEHPVQLRACLRQNLKHRVATAGSPLGPNSNFPHRSPSCFSFSISPRRKPYRQAINDAFGPSLWFVCRQMNFAFMGPRCGTVCHQEINS